MGEKLLMKGNEVIAEAALRAGCRHYFGYPITPQTEISHYMAKRMMQVGGVFMQAESEVAAINMVFGAGAAGKRVITTSSSPGISLKQEGISYISGARVPAVIVNIMRAGPGLGGIQPAQGDYFQSVKGGGHGDYKLIVLAPSSVQELYECTVDAFNLSDKYRMVTMILGDGMLGQMMEVVRFRDAEPLVDIAKPWATTGTNMEREHNVVTSIHLDASILEHWNDERQNQYRVIEQMEQKYELQNTENADVVLVAYGSVARIAKNVLKAAEKEGIKLGLLRPITLWPFPTQAFEQVMDRTKSFLVVEMSAGQMLEDVKLTVEGRRPVYFHGRMGGMIPTVADIMQEVREILGKKEAN